VLAKRTIPSNSVLEAFDQRRQAARRLHDDIGPLLSAAGLRLALLKMDRPDAREVVDEVQKILDDAMDRVRGLTQELSPSVVERAGLHRALEGLAERSGAALYFDTQVRAPIETGFALYSLAEWALAGSAGARISLRGHKTLRLEIRRREPLGRLPQLVRELAKRAQVEVEIRRERSTIVTARYAV
jgi:signal transduction histidine kinase